MKHKRIPKLRKRHLPLIAAIALALYLIFAYNYFFFRMHSSKLDWPDNRHTYYFNGSDGSNKVYAALGDSLTYGFGADNYQDSYTYQLADNMAKDGQGVTLKDFSYPGYKVRDVLETLEPAIAYKPSVVTLFVGVNDTNGLAQTRDFAATYDRILSRLISGTKAKIYVISVPYLGAKSILLPPFNYYFDAQTRARNDTIRKLAEKYQVNYIDLYGQTVDLFKKDGAHYSKDRYHPSTEGYKIWAGIIENDIRR